MAPNPSMDSSESLSKKPKNRWLTRAARNGAATVRERSLPASRAWLAALLLLSLVSAGGSETRLADAVKSGNLPAVKELLKKHANVNAAETDGTTPLEWAVRADDVEMARLLLGAGANANAANRDGVTALSLAATNRSAAMTDLLLKAGADPKTKLPGGETVLMDAARTGNPDVVRLLLAGGADVNARESTYGENALMWAAAQNHADAARLLLEHGAEVNARAKLLDYPKDRFGLEGVITVLPRGHWTPLMYAARQGSLATARVLVDAHADLNLTDPDSTTALVLAIINGHYDTAAMLVEKGADPNLADSAGMAALYAAVDMNTLGEVYGRPERTFPNQHSALDLIGMLLAHGANPNAKLLHPTLYRAHTPGEGTLAAGTTPIMRAAKNGDAAAMRLLLAHGADPTLTQKNGTTALMLAAGLGRGLGVFAKDYATDAQMLEGVKVLVARGVDVNAVDAKGDTAVHFAALSSDAIVKYLAEHGARLDIRDKQGRTPVDMAMGHGGPGRAGGPPVVRPQTAELIRSLMAGK